MGIQYTASPPANLACNKNGCSSLVCECEKFTKSKVSEANEAGSFCSFCGRQSDQYSPNLHPVSSACSRAHFPSFHNVAHFQSKPADLMFRNVAHLLLSTAEPPLRHHPRLSRSHFHPSVLRRSGFSASAAVVVHIHLQKTPPAPALFTQNHKCAVTRFTQEIRGPILPSAQSFSSRMKTRSGCTDVGLSAVRDELRNRNIGVLVEAASGLRSHGSRLNFSVLNNRLINA